jgi:hypothetical protein
VVAHAFSLGLLFNQKQDRQDKQVEKVEESYPDNASTTTIRAILEREFSDAPIMVDIAFCESKFRQMKDGSVLRGIQNSQDVGVLQVNEHYHLNSSIKMGLNIHTLEGNIKYSRYLYDNQGTKPWNWSKPCWSLDPIS